MLKVERHKKIIEDLEKQDIIKNSKLKKELNVTDMTLRRDLKELENKGYLIRIHGGAKSKNMNLNGELLLHEKREINIESKKYIAKLAAGFIKENDTVYIGPGTTNELLYEYINVSSIKVITNSLSIFQKFKNDKKFDLLLVGGKFREATDTFVGSFANETLRNLRVNIAIVGANGIYEDGLMTYNEEEGFSQKIILDNAYEKYALCDSSKIDKKDFYKFYKLENITAIITDKDISKIKEEQYKKYTKIIY
ncbi:DeoR/GlpR family DNA-binding transcription regulator (plasmid) [Clostridium perfringens]|uniref:Lactose phosphotransferase system repressor n=1 Tax=Clostridium perfringens E str. JGS1987 TaxID=451755 RepID=B1BU31_CLOPF|nr:DeoR/GlpR family DNA-binding transcription regulator [Clostridium perfringens]EDT14835.1 lactose phosphotransferase system repressor [Clostridium perfringens E str. JGS1987]ELC8332999.1 DeoR/GlpR transcriptional regulator [Clostridium perfringens]ELC8464188.1 DeoR/GlpR transcriptional regulator [Clostridium perfringens]MDK0553977.1 DeoR/GlpR family DNA-binding transcription regulator [Clostridium perfringens]MDT7988945.1 DeoR/GlpR family DNA-binding transcription regulator [Clostridium perf